MANKKHLAILREGVKAWNAWRKAHPDVWPDLRGADLVRADLVRADLAVADLTGANLEGANLYGANLAGAILERANLAEAYLRGANLERANLARANLAGANLARANLAWANLVRADLERADLAWADLAWANLERANLAEANLAGAILRGAIHYGAKLVRADLARARLEGAEQPGASDGDLALLTIPLHLRVPAADLGLILNGLADLYAVALEEGGEPRSDTLIAHRISVGTPNEVELIGMLPQITAIAAALVAVLKVPKALGEGAEKFAAAADKLAAARKTWIEGTLLKQKIGEKAEPQKRVPEASVARIEVAFNALAEGKEVISAEPTLKIVGARDPKRKQQSDMDQLPKTT